MDYRFSSAFANLAPSAIREILKNAGDPSVIAFAAGNPNAASFPLDDIRQLTADILDRNGPAALQYGTTEGYTPLREAVARRQKERFKVGRDFDDVLITSGGQQALELACRCLAQRALPDKVFDVLIEAAADQLLNGTTDAALFRNSGTSISVCAPLLFRSTSPGFGVVKSSRSSAKCAVYASVSEQNSSSSASVAALTASSPCARLLAQTETGPPHTRQRRDSGRDSLFPSWSSTSKS